MIVQMHGVEKRYGTTRALVGADLAVPDGAIMGIIGPNGAGKTTSMLIMSTLLARDAGMVSVAGYDPATQASSVRRILGYMPDFFGVYEGLDANEYLDFFASIQGVRPEARPAVVRSLLDLVGLSHKSTADVNTLSRGMKQRLSLARALVHDPQLLVLDEPASGLDPRARFELRELIAELARMGKTVVISSHILSELEDISTHLAVVDHGKVMAQGSLGEIRSALTNQVRITVRTRDELLDAAEAILRSDAGVSEFRSERGTVRFVFDGDDEASSRLLRRLIDGDVPVFEWRVETAGLEELFLKITDGVA
ncbi:MAG: ABC transporter ATP-binding protein [Acidimicrobiia bacterium]|nr:ABC transporter ATP-binding protein [Acidimicrobiia bacterium]